MKNIYNLNATRIESENFELRINYRDDAVGFNNPSLNEGTLTRDKPLIRLLGLDRLNSNNDFKIVYNKRDIWICYKKSI